MRTSVRLDRALFEQVKREAARRGQTVASMVEEGLRLVLAQSKPATGRSSVALPACQAGGGPLPGVDLNDSAALLDVMEGASGTQVVVTERRGPILFASGRISQEDSMPNQWSRREFLIASGLAAFQPAVSQTQPQAFILGFAPELGGKAGEEKWWHACDGCMRLGFHYTETNNGNIRLVETYKDRPAKFKEEMAKRKLTMAGFAWSTILSDRSRRQEVIDQNMQVSRFLQAVGGKYITHLFSPRPNGSLSREQTIERITKEEIKDFAATANELGKRMQEETGIRIAYHTERTEARFHLFDPIMEATDPRYFHFWADVGHLTAGGANPLDLIKKYRSRLIGVHLKDYDPNFEVERNGRREKGWFVPIGKGIVKFAPIIAYLKETRFNGHAMIELDGQPDPTEQMRDYAVKELGLKT